MWSAANKLKKQMGLGLLCWVGGMLVAFITISSMKLTNSDTIVSLSKYHTSSIFPDTNARISFAYAFRQILLTNLLLGVLVSVVGFVTAGIVTATVFLWNGFLLGLVIMKYTFVTEEPMLLMRDLFLHGSFEMLGLLWFGAYGFLGWPFVKSVFFTNEGTSASKLPQIRDFLPPTLLLFIAAFIEAIIVSLL